MQTDRILLRRWEDSDAESLFKYASDPDIGTRAGWPPHQSVEDSLSSIGYLTQDVSNIPIGENDCEVGYWVAKPYWNQGICTEALCLLLNYLINEKHFCDIWADYFTKNPASGRVMQKCGFKDTGKLHQCSNPSGASTGNPAASIFVDEGCLSPEQMLQIAAEHKGFVMETVFCSHSETAACKLTYYSSECEVDFCGHGTIATMYSFVKDDDSFRNTKVLSVETNKKGVISVYNEIDTEDAVYIEAPSPIEHVMNIPIDDIERILTLRKGSIDREGRAIRIIDAGLRTLIVPVTRFEDEVSVYPDVTSLKTFCEGNDIDIILIYSFQVADTSNFAHTRVFAPRFGYLEDPATGSGNSAFANYLLSEKMWDGTPITIEQGGNDRIFNAVKLKTFNGKVLFGGKATTKIQGRYFV